MFIGKSQVTRIEELKLELPSALLPDWRKERLHEYRKWLVPDFYDPERDLLKVSIHSWLVRTPRLNILIDTCAGNQKNRPRFALLNDLKTPWLDRLMAAGMSPEDIDFVICTHFHVDHVGWNTRLVDDRWVPTFPKATYIFPGLERELRNAGNDMVFRDSIDPVIEASQAMLVEGHEVIAEGIDLVPTPGHTVGQVAVRMRSQGKEALFVGDVLHHPLQVYHPEWNSNLCEQPDSARRTRLRILEHCANNGSLLVPAHFAGPYCGYVLREGTGFSFVPSEDQP